MLKLCVLLGLVVFSSTSNSATQLDYYEQDQWGGVCTAETSLAQSPIDITECVDTVNENGMVSYIEPITGITLENENNANTIKYAVSDSHFVVPWLNGREVTLVQLHLHWGEYAGEGSEHLVDGERFSAESHLVTSYTDGDTTKYMVFARLFEFTEHEFGGSEQLEQMIEASMHDEERDLVDFDLTALYPENPGAWYTYEGSLTTPTCDEVVTWVVVKETLPVSNYQLEILRDLPLGDGSLPPLAFNWRKTQASNGRGCTLYQ